MTAKNIEIQFEINGLQKTEDGINKITGSLTGLENLSKNTNTTGLTKLNKSIKDLTVGLAGMTGNLQSVTGLLTGLSTNLTTASDRVAAALEKMSTGAKTGVAATRTAVEGTAKAVKTSVKEIGDEIDHLTGKAAKLQSKANDHMDGLRYKAIAKQKAEIEAYQRSMLRAVVMQESSERKSSSRQADIDASRSATYSHLYQNNPKALLDRVGLAALASDRGMSTGALNRTYGTSLTQIVRDTTARASVVSHLTELINKQAIAEMNAAGAAKAALDANKQAGKAEQDRLRNSSEYVKWWTKKLASQEQTARKAETAQQASDAKFNQGLRIKEASRSGAEVIRSRDINANRMSENNFLYENNPQGLLTRVQRARKAALSDVSDADMLSKYGTHLTQIVRDTRAYEGVVSHLTSVIQAAATAKQNDANATKEQAASLRKARTEAEQLSKRSYTADAKYFAASLTPTRQLGMLQNAYGEYQYGKQSGKLNEAEFTKKHGSNLFSIVSDASKYKQELAGIQTAIAAAEEAHLRFGRTGHDLFRGLTSGIGMIWLSWGQLLPMLGGFAASAGVRAMLQIGTQFEHQMKIIQVLSQETSGTLRGAQQQILEMSTSSLFGLNEMVGGLKALTQAGFSTQDAMKNLKTVMNLSMLGEVSPDQSALFLAGLRTTFKDDPTIKNGKGEVDLSQAANITAIAAARSQTSISEMMESMKQASTVADEYHLRLTDVSVGLQLLAERNITGSAAGTSLRNAMEDLTGRTEKARKALALLKVSLYDDKTGAARNPFDVMNDIRSKMENFSESKRKRFLQEFTDERGKKLLEAFLAKSDAEIRQMQAVTFRAGENGGFVSKGADDINTSLQSLSGQTLNTFRKTAVEVFDSVNPGLKELMQGFKEMAGSSELKTTLSVLAQGLLGLAKAVSFTVSAITNLTPALLGMAGGFAAFQLLQSAPAIVTAVSTAVMGLVSASRGGAVVGLLPTALAALTNPATYAVAGLMAVGGAMAYVWANTETANDRLAASKSRLENLSSSLAAIRSDVYAKLNQGENGSQALGENIDDKLSQRLERINSSASALQNLSAIQDEFTNRSAGKNQKLAEQDIEREMFLMERKRSFLRQQLDEFDQFLRTKGMKESDYYKERDKFLQAATDTEDALHKYEMQLSNLRIEQTRKEVEERSKMYLGLGQLLLSSSDKKLIESPLDYATNGDAYSDSVAIKSRVGALKAGQTAGQDVSRDAIVLQQQAVAKLGKLDQGIAHLDMLIKQNQDNPGAYLNKITQQRKNAATNRQWLNDLIYGTTSETTTGTIKSESIANLLEDQKASNLSRLAVPRMRKNGPDKNISDLDHQKREPEGPTGPLMSLIDKITGEDSGTTKLKNILGLVNDKDGLDSKAISTVFESLKAQGSGPGFDLVKNFKTSDDLRKYLKDFVDEHMTFEGKLKSGYRKLTDDLKAQVTALQDDSQAGDSDSFVRMLRFRAAELKKHDDYYNAQVKEAKGNQGLIDKIEAERQRTRGDFEQRTYAASVADVRKFGDDEVRRAKNEAGKEAAAQMADIAERTKEMNRQFTGFNQWLKDSSDSMKTLSFGLEDVNTYLKKFTLAGLPGDAWSAGKGVASSFFETDSATRNLRLAPTLGRLQDKLDTKLGNNEVEARRLFNPDQYDKGTAEYDAANDAYNKYLTQRNNAARDAYDREVQFAKDAFDKQQSFGGQTQQALTKFWTETATPAEIYGKTMESGLNKLTQAFIDSAHGAEHSFWMIKKGFKDLVKDMLIQMAVTQMMKATTSAISMGIGLVGSAIGAYFGGGAGAGGAATATTTAAGYSAGTVGSGITPPAGFSFTPTRAAGGAVTAGRPYMVGEQGWEVFVPQTDGHIVPNQIARNATKGADSYNVAITINDNSVSQQSSEQSAGGKQNNAADIGAQIKAKVMEVLVEQKRAGGVLSR